MLNKFILLVSISMSFTITANPIIFTDAADREIILNKPAERVAVLYNFVDYAAIAGKECYGRVVGIGKKAWQGWRNGIWNHYLNACPEIENIADIGMFLYGDFYMEKTISLAPEVIILPLWQYKAISDAQKNQLQQANITLIVTDYANQQLNSHIKSTMAIGYTIGKVERAREIVEFYQQQIMKVTSRLNNKPKPTYYIEKGQKGALQQDETWSKTVWGQIGDNAGGRNIADDVIEIGKNGHITPEKVLFSNPDFIFITGSHWIKNPKALSLGYNITKSEANNVLVSYKNRLGWTTMNAITSGQLYGMHHGLARSLMDFSAIQFMAKQFYPEALQDIYPENNLIEFHERFLPVKYQGTWLFKANF
ncbi:ABC transporter substrate-binding protein [Aliivibrio fischeri]|uniref:ABC transporter substrate-binding protein n=1 Tax=Aliivibrio fischeri TaxID=668 RepID=UPI0012D9EB2C|nr:ABC transporter substrate-binding protein [Aliivibrio fischeri]MUI53034.1 ABC transporter substrate-binding protein [Aliivibrio fischeri]